MNRKEAIQSLIHGFAVTHKTFTDVEHVRLDGEDIIDLVDEDDNSLDWDDFWNHRSTEQWEDGWSIKDISISWDVAKLTIHDASGLPNPEKFRWEKFKGVYYPAAEIFVKKMDECDHSGERIMIEAGGDAESGPVTFSYCADCGHHFTAFGM
jgi:hypothetical protein